MSINLASIDASNEVDGLTSLQILNLHSIPVSVCEYNEQ